MANMERSDPGTTHKSNQCRWLHDWGTWHSATKGSLHDGDRRIGVVITQYRSCNRCKYTQTKLDVVLV